MEKMATPETGAVDAPASMDSVLAEFETDAPAGDAADEVVTELVEEAEEGEADEGEKPGEEADEGDATDAADTDEETAEEETEEEQGEPEPTYKVKVAGEEIEVSLPELLKGYSREQDYTRKTMALAEAEKSVKARFAEELQQQVTLFEQLDPILAEAGQIDWQRLATEDPATYVQLKAAVDERKATLDQAKARIAEATKGNTEEDRVRNAQVAQAETQALITKAKEVGIADLSTPEAMNSFAQNAVSYLRGTGYDDAEIAEVTDHRALLIIEKARRFDELERAKAKLPAKKIIPKSQVKPLKSDGSDSSKAPRNRFPANAPREKRLDFIVDQLIEKG